MGIDALDMHFRIEKTFQISLSIEEMRSLMRDDDLYVGDLYDYLLEKLTLRDRARYDVHLNYKLWRDVQRKLQSITNRPMEEIALDTPLQELFPGEKRRTAWAALREASSHRLPELEYPVSFYRTCGLLALGVTICLLTAVVWGLKQIGLWVWPFWLFVVPFGLSLVFEIDAKLERILPSQRTELPAWMVTVKDLCRAILADNYTQICEQGEASIDKRCLDVWRKLQGILHEVLQIEPAQITFKSGLILDLGMS